MFGVFLQLFIHCDFFGSINKLKQLEKYVLQCEKLNNFKIYEISHFSPATVVCANAIDLDSIQLPPTHYITYTLQPLSTLHV